MTAEIICDNCFVEVPTEEGKQDAEEPEPGTTEPGGEEPNGGETPAG